MVSGHASPLAVPTDGLSQHIYLTGLCAQLAASGDEVTVYTRRDGPDLPDRMVTEGGVVVVHVPAGPAEPIPTGELLPHLGEFADFLAAAWQAEPPDVVHGHYWTSGLAAMLAARSVDVPVVQTFHALGAPALARDPAPDPGLTDRIPIERVIGRAADAVLPTSAAQASELVRMGVPRARGAVVPCGVDNVFFSPTGPVADRAGARFRVVSVGDLVPSKGFDVAVAAMCQIGNAELVIAGGPDESGLDTDPEARRLRDLAVRLGVADRVRLLGRVERADLPALLRSADVMVCASWYEPFGIAPLEAMACGVPVVASAVGALTDTVVDGVTGIHVRPRAPVALSRAVRSLQTDPTRRTALALAGRDRACSRYSWARVASEVTRVYEQVSAKKRQPASRHGAPAAHWRRAAVTGF